MTSSIFEGFKKVVNNINYNNLIRIKANLNSNKTGYKKSSHQPIHYDSHSTGYKSLIYYVNIKKKLDVVRFVGNAWILKDMKIELLYFLSTFNLPKHSHQYEKLMFFLPRLNHFEQRAQRSARTKAIACDNPCAQRGHACSSCAPFEHACSR